MPYIWEHTDWPGFSWDEAALAPLVARVSREQGRLLGRMEGLGFDLRTEAHLRTLTEDVVKTSEIEGENLDAEQVRSSIARRLGLEIGGLVPSDRNVDGIVEIMLDATGKYDAPLTEARLFDWHAALFPTGRSGMSKIIVGGWRDDAGGPMQVVSGAMGKEKVHFEAPPAARVPTEINEFTRWFEKSGETDPLLFSGVAHLWFVTIHPFKDGNGRISRAIADLALSRSEQSSLRFYSMSSQICEVRKSYYDVLERTQKSNPEITEWLVWYLECLLGAFDKAQDTLTTVLGKARFWERFAQEPLNHRQIKVLNKMLNGFEGKMTTSKWAKIAKCSQDTAYRDIVALIDRGAMAKDEGGGRSTSYSLIARQE